MFGKGDRLLGKSTTTVKELNGYTQYTDEGDKSTAKKPYPENTCGYLDMTLDVTRKVALTEKPHAYWLTTCD